MAQTVKHLPAMQETWVQSLGREYPLDKEMATHSNTLAWKIPWMEEAGRLQSMGSQRVATERLHFNLCERESKIRLGSFFLFFFFTGGWKKDDFLKFSRALPKRAC